MDTVRFNGVVSSVSFIGQERGVKLPDPKRDDMRDDYRECFMLSFSYSNAIQDTSSGKIELRTLAIWKNPEVFPLYMWQASVSQEKRFVDSALRSASPFDIDF